MKIVTLVENSTLRPDLACEHGLSLYIETGTHKILFDMGQSGNFAENARKLGLDLADVDIAVVSHGHYDHGGGLDRFLQLNSKAPVYLSGHAFERHCNAAGKDIGLAPTGEEHRLVFVDRAAQIAPGITVCSGKDRLCPYPVESAGMTFGSDSLPEDFRHEIYLLIREEAKTVCISGCSHKGIFNILRWFQPDVLVGGFHFMKITQEETLQEAAELLAAFPTRYFTGHCTGETQAAVLRRKLMSRLESFATGSILEI